MLLHGANNAGVTAAANGTLNKQFKLKNTGASTDNSMPFDFMIPMKAGDLLAGDTINLNDGAADLTVEVDQITTINGNVRAALCSVIGPASSFTSGAEVTLTATAVTGTRKTASGKTYADLIDTLATDFDCDLEIVHEDGNTYTVSCRDILDQNNTTWTNEDSKVRRERLVDNQVCVKEMISGPVQYGGTPTYEGHIRANFEISWFSTDAWTSVDRVRIRWFLTNGFFNKAGRAHYHVDITTKTAEATPVTYSDATWVGETVTSMTYSQANLQLTRTTGTWGDNDVGKFVKNANGNSVVRLTNKVSTTVMDCANAETMTVTGATQANPVKITVNQSHGLTTGDTVHLWGFSNGMQQLEDRSFTVTVTSTTEFTLDGEDGTLHTAFSDNGLVIPEQDWDSARVWGIGLNSGGVVSGEAWWNGESDYRCRHRFSDIKDSEMIPPYNAESAVQTSNYVTTMYNTLTGEGTHPQRKPYGPTNSGSGGARDGDSFLGEASCIPGVQAMALQDNDANSFLDENSHDLILLEAKLYHSMNGNIGNRTTIVLPYDDDGHFTDMSDATKYTKTQSNVSTDMTNNGRFPWWDITISHMENPNFLPYLFEGDFTSLYLLHAHAHHSWLWLRLSAYDGSFSSGFDRQWIYQHDAQARTIGFQQRNIFLAAGCTPDVVTAGNLLQWSASDMQTWANKIGDRWYTELTTSGQTGYTHTSGNIVPHRPMMRATTSVHSNVTKEVSYTMVIWHHAHLMDLLTANGQEVLKRFSVNYSYLNETDMTTTQFDTIFGTDGVLRENNNGGLLDLADIIDGTALTCPQWATSTAYSAGDLVWSNYNFGTGYGDGERYVYQCETAISSSSSEPQTVGQDIVDNDGTWNYIGTGKDNAKFNGYALMDYGCTQLFSRDTALVVDTTAMSNALTDKKNSLNNDLSESIPLDGLEGGGSRRAWYYYFDES